MHPEIIRSGAQEILMETLRVGIREFRDKLASYLLESDVPVAITRHGDTGGSSYAVRGKGSHSAALSGQIRLTMLWLLCARKYPLTYPQNADQLRPLLMLIRAELFG